MSSGDSAEKQEMRDENDELQDQEQFEKSEEFEDQGLNMALHWTTTLSTLIAKGILNKKQKQKRMQTLKQDLRKNADPKRDLFYYCVYTKTSSL
jgi:hypothetical protein